MNTTVMMVVRKCNGFACLQVLQDVNHTVAAELQVLWRSTEASLEHSAIQLWVRTLLNFSVCCLPSKYTFHL